MSKLVYVEWIDSAAGRGWQSRESFEKNDAGPVLCMSAGFLVRETKDYIIVASSRGHEDESFLGDVAIPKAVITKRRRLK